MKSEGPETRGVLGEGSGEVSQACWRQGNRRLGGGGRGRLSGQQRLPGILHPHSSWGRSRVPRHIFLTAKFKTVYMKQSIQLEMLEGTRHVSSVSAVKREENI